MQFRHQTLVDISADDDKSAAIDLAEQVINFVVFPGALTSTTFGFEINDSESRTAPSLTDANWKTVVDTTGAAISYTCAVDTAVSLDWSVAFGARWVRLTLGSSEGADRTITVFTQQIG